MQVYSSFFKQSDFSGLFDMVIQSPERDSQQVQINGKNKTNSMKNVHVFSIKTHLRLFKNKTQIWWVNGLDIRSAIYESSRWRKS